MPFDPLPVTLWTLYRDMMTASANVQFNPLGTQICILRIVEKVTKKPVTTETVRNRVEVRLRAAGIQPFNDQD